MSTKIKIKLKGKAAENVVAALPAVSSSKTGAPRVQPVGDPADYEPTYGSPKVSTSNDVAFEKAPRLNPVGSGILETQNGNYGARYPGRPTPTPSPVTQAQEKPGTAKKAADVENDSNRREQNTRVGAGGNP